MCLLSVDFSSPALVVFLVLVERTHSFRFSTVLFSFQGATTVYPLDLAKSILQDQRTVAGQTPKYSGILDIVKSRYQTLGFRGLYSGYSANLVGIMPEKATKFFGQLNIHDELHVILTKFGSERCDTYCSWLRSRTWMCRIF